MKNSKEIAQTVFDIRNTYIENKRLRRNKILSVVKLAAPAAACLGLAIAFGINYWSEYSKMPEVEIQPANTVISDIIDTIVSNNSKTSSTTVVTSDKTVSAAVKADESRSGNDSSEEYTEYDSSEEYTEYDSSEEYTDNDSTDSTEEDSTISADGSAVKTEIKKPSVTAAPSQTKGKTTRKITAVSVTKAAVPTTEVTQTEPVQTTVSIEIPEPTANSREEEITMALHRVYERIDDMDFDNYRSNLSELYSELYEILESDYMSDEGRESALTRLHEKEKQMQCLFPRVTDIINDNLSPYTERLTYDQVIGIIESSENVGQLYWNFMIYCPDVMEDLGFLGKREYWLDDYGEEKIIFYSTSGNVFYEHCGDTEQLCSY